MADARWNVELSCHVGIYVRKSAIIMWRLIRILLAIKKIYVWKNVSENIHVDINAATYAINAKIPFKIAKHLFLLSCLVAIMKTYLNAPKRTPLFAKLSVKRSRKDAAIDVSRNAHMIVHMKDAVSWYRRCYLAVVTL